MRQSATLVTSCLAACLAGIALAADLACPDCGRTVQSMDGTACPYCMSWFPPRTDEKKREYRERVEEIAGFLRGSDKIDFLLTRESLRAKSPDHTISGHAQVTNFLAGVAFEPKGPCQCGHSRSMIFSRGTNAISISFCDHCFDVSNTGNALQKMQGTMGLRMPVDLWKRIEAIEKGQCEPGVRGVRPSTETGLAGPGA